MRNMVLLAAIFGFVLTVGWAGVEPLPLPELLTETTVAPIMSVEVLLPEIDSVDALEAIDLALDNRCPDLGPIAL